MAQRRPNPKIKVGHVKEVFLPYDTDPDGDGEERPLKDLVDELDYYIAVDVTVGRYTAQYAASVGIMPSEQGSARASGALSSYGGGPDAWWEDSSDWQDARSREERDAVLNAIMGAAGRLYGEAQAEAEAAAAAASGA